MKINKIILLITLTLILLGITYATENNTDTTIQDNPHQETIKNTQEQNTIKNIETQEKPDNKEIKKQNNQSKTTKTSTQADITEFYTMYYILSNHSYESLNLNIKANIELEDKIEVNQGIKKLTINGNGKTINGQGKYQFLNISQNSKVSMKNLKIIKCKDDFGGAISNSGTLTITNCTLNNNNAKECGGAIYNNWGGNLIIKNSTINKNTVGMTDNTGGAIYNRGKLTLINDKLNNNKADGGGAILNENILIINKSQLNYNKAYRGGAILNFYKITINKSSINKNNAKECGGAIYNNWGILNINDNTLNNNNAYTDGGAIYTTGSLSITHSTLNNNKAKNKGGAICESTYAIKSSKKFQATFKNNSATRGGAIYLEGISKNLQINSNFTRNHASFGGAIYNNDTNNIQIKGNFNYNYATNDYYFIKDKGKNTKITCNQNKFKYGKNGGSIYNNQGKNLTINIKSTQKIKQQKLKSKLKINTIPKSSLNKYITIKGKFTDEYGNELINSRLTLKINSKTYYTKTNKKGLFTYKYKTTKTGTNKVTATFKGNTNYKASYTIKTFTVTNYNTVELYTHLLDGPYPEDSKRVGDDIFTAWYQLTDRQNEKGVHIFVEDYYASDMGDPAHNLIVDATFYFKNNAGKIITKKFETGTGGRMYHSLVSGYTPYKVVAEYRKMTSAEKNKWNNGYGYNPKTKKWFSYY